jgi:hypothetical protein
MNARAHGTVDPALLSTAQGISAVKWSLLILTVTAAVQIVIVVLSGSVALLADTVHNVGDALTAVPLWIAFSLSRRPPTKRFTPPGRRDPGLGWGAVRVEAWGWRGTARTSVVYGVIERTAVAAGTVLGVTGACLCGALPDLAAVPAAGAVGLGSVVEPVPFLAELARRGVKAAAFEGVAVA